METGFKWRGPEAMKLVRDAAISALQDVAESKILKEANDLVPHATGTLERTGTVSPFSRADNSITISYSGPYAIRMHEDLSLRHPDPTNPISSSGCSAKYLENPFNKHKSTALKLVAVRVKSALDRAR